MQRQQVLLVGDYEHRDFREAVDWLQNHTQLSLAAGLDAAYELLTAEPWTPTVIIAQSRPGRFPAVDVERLHRASPLSRLVALLGSWCEGEMRTGRPWPGVFRVLWHQWQPRLIPQLTANSDIHPALWTLPRTASAAEQMALLSQVAWPRREALISVRARTLRDYRALGEPCAVAGYATVWIAPGRATHVDGVAAAIVDAVAVSDAEQNQLQEIVATTVPGPVIAVLDYVRRQDYDRALAAGVSAVIAKPVLMYDLLWHLNDLLNPNVAESLLQDGLPIHPTFSATEG
jgi:hypothetical protein